VIGLLVKQDGHYRHSPSSREFLDPNSPASIASIARFLGASAFQETAGSLAEIVRRGHPVSQGEGVVEADNPIWVEFAHSMAPMMAPLAAPLGAIALEGFAGAVQVLDIAAGHGLFGIEVARQNPRAEIVALDWAAVLEVAAKNAREAGVESRYRRLPGSAFDVDFGGPYDIVLLTNFLHHFDPPTCTTLLRKVRAALKPGGRAATLEFVPNEDRVSPPMPATFSLTMLVGTPAGDAYTFSELEKLHRDAGFVRIAAQAVAMSPHTIVTAHVD
jgi:SAM-dependent methyltransferase